jgi:organic hydroperoxide reductase OsmC/OhrA
MPAGHSPIPVTHLYQVRCSWSGATGVGYEAYGRDHEVSAPPADARLTLSSDPVFRGDPTRLNPEQLLVMAAASCQLLSFLAVAARARLDVVGYQDDAVGEMPEGNNPEWITRIVLRPRITIAPTAMREPQIRHLVGVAHRQCYIANSLKTEVLVEPTILVSQTSQGDDEFGGAASS